MTPQELLHDLVDQAVMDSYCHSFPDRKREPGYFVKRLSAKDREILSQLESSKTDTSVTRLQHMIEAPGRYLSELCLKEDKKHAQG